MRTCRHTLLPLLLGLILPLAATLPVVAQQQSLKPGINRPYENPDVQRQVQSLERDSRVVVENHEGIVTACQLEPGMAIADVGAGTGLFTRMFAAKVKPGGKVYAVEIAQKFLDHIEKTCKEKGVQGVVGVLGTATSAELAPESIDRAFLCVTYHHFEYPFKMLDSIYQAMRGGGRLIIVDYKRKQGVSPQWVFGHVRADKKTVIEEVTKAGFKFVDEVDLMKVQYVIRFEKPK